uniref:Gustatory receptor n=1 Tax=Anopheles stephensi TaxID=30069 RepID=A0A182XWS1_ANOST
MRTENFVILVHNIFGGPLGSNNERTLTPLQMFLHTAILIGTSGALFILCLCDLHRMLYQRDLVLSVIDLLMLLGIAITVFTIQASALIKYVRKPTESILHYLDDIDGHLYTLSIRHDPAQRLRFNCAACFASAIVLSIGYLLANVLRISRPNALVFAFKTYGMFVVLLMHGLFLVFSHQILTRVRCMSKHLKKMISTTNTGTEYGSIRLGRDLRTLATVQMQCFRAVNRLNEDCGLPNVTIFEPIVLIVAVFSYFFTTTYLGELVLRETQLVINNLHKFESKHSMRPQKTNYSELVEQLGHQILHQPICFTVMNFFQIDFKFFHLVMASVGTYLIILLQFDFQN